MMSYGTRPDPAPFPITAGLFPKRTETTHGGRELNKATICPTFSSRNATCDYARVY